MCFYRITRRGQRDQRNAYTALLWLLIDAWASVTAAGSISANRTLPANPRADAKETLFYSLGELRVRFWRNFWFWSFLHKRIDLAAELYLNRRFCSFYLFAKSRDQVLWSRFWSFRARNCNFERAQSKTDSSSATFVQLHYKAIQKHESSSLLSNFLASKSASAKRRCCLSFVFNR